MKEYIERDSAAAFAYNCGAVYVSNRLSDKIAFPAADVVPIRHGRWIQGNGYVECSECNTIGSPHWKCCPVCTAMMDLEVTNGS